LLRISKKFNTVIELSKNNSARLPNFSKKVHQSYRTFQKISGKVRGLFGKNEGPKHTYPRLIVSGTLPDFSKKSRQDYRTFSKMLSKVSELFKNCLAKSSDFLKIVHQGYQPF
jgi:hypothetical protein